MSIFDTKGGNEKNARKKTTIKTSGGAFIGGNSSVSGDGTVVLGKNSGDISTVNRSASSVDEDKVAILLQQLNEHIGLLPERTAEERKLKEKAGKARDKFEQELAAARRDNRYEPDEITMDGLIAAFKQVGGPVLTTALSIMGLPGLAQIFSQFTQSLPVK